MKWLLQRKVQCNIAINCDTFVGPSDALLTAGNLTAGRDFDSGNACASGSSAYVFVKNSCLLPARATINVGRPPFLTHQKHPLGARHIQLCLCTLFMVKPEALPASHCRADTPVQDSMQA